MGKYTDNSGGSMFSMKEDYDDFEPIPEGRHLAMADGLSVMKSKAGKPMISARFVLIAGDSVGLHLYEYFVLEKGPGFRRLQDYCRAVDPNMKGRDQDPEEGINPFDQESVDECLMAAPFGLVVHHEEEIYDGKKRTRERIQEYFSLSEKAESHLERKYGEDCVPELPDDAHSWKRNGTDDRQTTSVPVQNDFSDDDIPF